MIPIDSLDDYPIDPQISAMQDERYKENFSQFKVTVETISWGNFILNLILSKGLKHLWGLVNLMQFMVYFLLW